jgi:SAM-dependent methyltransferase
VHKHACMMPARGRWQCNKCATGVFSWQGGVGRLGIAGRSLKCSRWVQGDALSLPFQDGEFDAATMGYGLRNVADVSQALRELHRVLRPGAARVHATPSRHPLNHTPSDGLVHHGPVADRPPK